jgi:hypothetical protein
MKTFIKFLVFVKCFLVITGASQKSVYGIAYSELGLVMGF